MRHVPNRQLEGSLLRPQISMERNGVDVEKTNDLIGFPVSMLLD